MILVLQNKNIVEAHFLQDRHNKLPIHYRPGWHLLSKNQMHTGQKRIQCYTLLKEKVKMNPYFFFTSSYLPFCGTSFAHNTYFVVNEQECIKVKVWTNIGGQDTYKVITRQSSWW